MTSDRDHARAALLAEAGWGAAPARPLAGDASFRRYERLERSDGARAVLMDADPGDGEDCRPFAAIAGWLRGQGFSAPEVMAADFDAGFLVLEDLGDDLFSRAIASGAADEHELYAAAVDQLVDLAGREAPPSAPLPGHGAVAIPDYDFTRLMDEAALLLDWWWPAVMGAPAPADARAGYVEAWRDALGGLGCGVLSLRDYHADNLIWLGERAGAARIGLLDFQDAVRGHPAYDLASLIEDARRDVAPELARAMIARWTSRAAALGPDIDHEEFEAAIALLGAQRNAKIVGIFTRLCARDGKPDYLALIPRVWGHLNRSLAHPALKPVQTWFARWLEPETRRAPTAAQAARIGRAAS